MDVSLVVPTYQGRHLLPRTLTHLKEVLAKSTLEVDVIVVDDASDDGSADYIRTEHPWVRLVALEENHGFSGATNAGADRAAAPYIYFMNSDVFPHRGFLESALARFESDDSLFSVMSVNLNPAGAIVPPNQVTPRVVRGQIRVKGMALDDLWQSGRLRSYGPILTLYGAGGSVLVRRDRFEALGGFSEAFRPFYYEDTDLGWRAWRRGWRTILDPGSVVVHDHESGSITSSCEKRQVLAHRKRNRFILLWRNYLDPRDFRRHHVWRLPTYLARKVLSFDRITLRGFASAYRAREGVREHREHERDAECISNRELFKILEIARQELRDYSQS